jgi:hypothetical protein
VTEQHNPLERAVDLFVYAPIGVAMFAKDTVPTFLKMFVSRGQTELEAKKKTLHHQANQYKAVGKLAVKYGGPEVKRQAESKIGGARKLAEETFTGLVVARSGGTDDGAPTPTPKVTRIDEPAKVVTNGAVNGKTNGATKGAPVISDPLVENALAPTSVPTPSAPAAPAAADVPAPPEAPALAIPEYDQLSASQVVERLDGLSPDELDAVRAYELAHRGRNTILGKITQLTS